MTDAIYPPEPCDACGGPLGPGETHFVLWSGLDTGAADGTASRAVLLHLAEDAVAEAAAPYVAREAVLREALQGLVDWVSGQFSDGGFDLDAQDLLDAAEAVLSDPSPAVEAYRERIGREAVEAAAMNARLVRVAPELLDNFGTRTIDGKAITAEWGEPDGYGVYTPTLTATEDGWLEGERREAVEAERERLWKRAEYLGLTLDVAVALLSPTEAEK